VLYIKKSMIVANAKAISSLARVDSALATSCLLPFGFKKVNFKTKQTYFAAVNVQIEA